MSPRARVYSIVGACAAGAAAAIVGITAATHHSPPKPLPPRAGSPPFSADWTAPAALSKEVHVAVGNVAALRRLARSEPRSSFVHLNLGLALFWQRDDAGALEQWRMAKRVAPDTPSAVRAGDLLHPNTPHGLPQFQPTFTRATSPAERLLLQGARLQAEQRPISAERAYKQAVALAPNDPEANVAAAVGLFDKDDPTPAFSHLGPLVRRFPHAQTVRFHLGLLSIWIAQFAQARTELRLAVADDPKSLFAREANLLLSRLGKVGTG
ncbi:MAG: tetratricopeptide repeat protein [Gaiellaceae bacterium]